MQEFIQAAVLQMNSTLDKRANLAQAEALLREGIAAGAELIVLPELFNAYGPLPQVVAQAEPIPGPTSEKLSAWAAQWGIYLCGGSIAESAEEKGKAYNTSLLFGPAGQLLGKYRKMHRFDVNLHANCTSQESDVVLAGEEVVVSPCPLGKIGQAICYDLRFPELFRQLSASGSELILLPSAFTAFTGQDHWETLVRARAIENQTFVLAANQIGEHAPGMTSWGHSLIVDPWGRVLAALTDEVGIAVASLPGKVLEEIRQRLPALAHRRL